MIKNILACLGFIAILIALVDWIATGVLVPYSHSYYILVAGYIMLIPGGPGLVVQGIEHLQKKLSGGNDA